jgi:hypothetical protein
MGKLPEGDGKTPCGAGKLCLKMAQQRRRQGIEGECHVSLACFAASSGEKNLDFLA